MVIDIWKGTKAILFAVTVLSILAVTPVKADPVTFDLQWSGDCGTDAFGIAIGDTDNDGANELVVFTRENLSVLKWNSSSEDYELQWETVISPQTDNAQKVVVIADTDNDGFNEIAVSAHGSSPPLPGRCAYIYEWNGFTYVLQGTTPPAGRATDSITVGDVDGDGSNEVVVGTTDGYYYGHVRVLEWTGTAYVEQWRYGDPVHVGYGNLIYANREVIGDCDNDGYNEILAGDYFGHLFVFKWNDTTSTYQAQWINRSASYGWNAYGLAVGDADNDGNNEIVVGAGQAGTASRGWIGSLKWNSATGSYEEYDRISPYMATSPYEYGRSWFGIAIGDVDHDGNNELIAGNHDGEVYVLEWNGPSYAEEWSEDIGSCAWGIAIGDADNDGYNEFVVGNKDGEVFVYKGPIPIAPIFNSPKKADGKDYAIAHGIVEIDITAPDPFDNLLSVNLTVYNETFLQNIPLIHQIGTWNWTGRWNSLTVADGMYTMKATSTHNITDSLVQYSTELPILVDNTPPSVSITSPTDGSNVFGVVDISADVFDDGVGVWIVFFYVDGELQGSDDTPPYSCEWNTSGASEGTHTIEVVAYDFEGNNASDVVNVAVTDTTPPTVSFYFLPEMEELKEIYGADDFIITRYNSWYDLYDGGWYGFGEYPSPYYSYNALFPLLIVVSDESGIEKVEFYTNDTLGYTTTPFLWDGYLLAYWDISNVDFPDGYVEFKVSVYDNSSNHNCKNETWVMFIDNTPPSGHFVIPFEWQQTVYGTELVCIEAHDNYGVLGAQFRVDDQYVGWIDFYGLDFGCLLWDTTALADGVYLCRAVIFDYTLQYNTAYRWVEVNNSGRPSVKITSPSHDSFVRETETISVDVETELLQIEKVEFYIDDVLKHTDTSSPYSWDWGTTAYSDGTHTIRAVAYDSRGNNSDTIQVTVDNTPPSVSITKPATDDAISGTILVEAEASDENGIQSVSFYIDGNLIFTDTDEMNGWSVLLDTTVYSEGTYTLRAEAADTAGNTNSSTISIDIRRPHISIRSITVGGPYKLYTIGENEVKITVTLENTGEVDGDAVVRLQDLTNETDHDFTAAMGKQARLVTVPATGSVSIDFTFTITDYDWVDGWISKGFSPGSYSVVVNVTNVFGTEIYDTRTSDSFTIKKGPQFVVDRLFIDYDSDGDGTVEVGEYFLLSFRINNTGDENVSSITIKSYSIKYREITYDGFEIGGNNVMGFHLWCSNERGLKIGEFWWTSHYDGLRSFGLDPSDYTYKQIAEFYRWKAATTGVARVNFYITYTDSNGAQHETMLKKPITFPIYKFDKTLSQPQVKTDGVLEVTVFGVEDDNVKAKIRNKGNVYYTYKINGQPAQGLAELLSFLAPGGQVKKTISTEGVATNYKFTVQYNYSGFLNTLDGSMIAISPVLPSPLDKIPLFIEIILLATQGVISEEQLASHGVEIILEEMAENSAYRDAIIAKATEKYGKDIGKQLTKDLLKEIGSLATAVPQLLQWAWNNLKAPVSGYLEVNITDPPREYNVTGKSIPGPLFFGGLSNETAMIGEGNINITIEEDGRGEYHATYEISTPYTSLDEINFDIVSMLVVSKVGKRTSSVMKGNVTIYMYPTPDSTINLSKILLADTGFAESIVESYFVKMKNFESRLVGDHIELKGTGELQSSIYDDEVVINLTITKKKVNANFYQKGRYGEVTDSGIKVNISFGPRFNIPLNNTRLSISVPYDVVFVSPEPDYINPKLHWNQTPSHVTIYSSPPPPAPVPALTPIGLIALVGLLSVIAAVSIRTTVRKKRE